MGAAAVIAGVAEACTASDSDLRDGLRQLPVGSRAKIVAALRSSAPAEGAADSVKPPEVQAIQVTAMDGTSLTCELPTDPNVTVQQLKEAVEAVSGGKLPADELVLVAGTATMESSHALSEYGCDQGVTAVLQDPADGGKSRRARLAKTDAASAVLATLEAMQKHAASRCKYDCALQSRASQLCKEEREYRRCTSPDDNPYGPCSSCRMGPKVTYVPQLRCPEAASLNEEITALKRLAQEQRKRAGPKVTHVPQLKCPEAASLNEEITALKRLAQEQRKRAGGRA